MNRKVSRDGMIDSFPDGMVINGSEETFEIIVKVQQWNV
jgi:hypothetical protein